MKYLVINHSVQHNGEPTIFRANELELFAYLQAELEKPEEERHKFAVYRIGECLLDLS